MLNSKRLSRRRLLSGVAAGAAVCAAPSLAFSMGAGMGAGMGAMKRLAPNVASPTFNPDVEVELRAAPAEAQILDGPATRVWRYAARLIKGPQSTLTSLPGSYLGDVLRFRTGQKIRIRLQNALPEPTIAHWHGLHVPALMDGHPIYAIDPGESFVYEFEMRNRAGFYFYHPHTHEATATQVYRGLAGGIIVNDDEEDSLGLPAGEFEIPLVLQDRSFDDGNQLVYDDGMHERMTGFQGDRVLVNGKADFALEVASRAYRLRLLNGSNARIYKLAWSDDSPIVVLGVDGGLLEAPETKPYVMLAPGERLDLWADFSARKVGSELVMRSAPFSGALPKMAEHMMGGMMMRRTNLPPGDDYPLFKVRVTRAEGDSPRLPTRLSKIKRLSQEDTANPQAPRPIAISEAPMSMLLNGRAYAYDDALPIEKMPLDTLQLIEIFRERRGHGMMGMRGMMGGMGMGGGGMGMGMGMGMMMTMAHPIHLHGQQFQILERRLESGDADDYATMSQGFVTSGLKDTVLVAPGERVRIVKPFQHYKGAFMYHCHNLEHEDMGMMREFWVE
jgi:blue copper oxidase